VSVCVCVYVHLCVLCVNEGSKEWCRASTETVRVVKRIVALYEASKHKIRAISMSRL
jgi:hypothetical protein